MKEHDMALRGNRGGFALPMAILVIGFLTASVMAAFARAGAEVRVVDNQQAQLRAFAVASAGLEQYIARGRIAPLDTVIAFGADSAHVTVTLMHAPAFSDTSLYLVRSTARTRGGVGRPVGTRTVSQFAHRVVGRLAVNASWTSLSGLVKHGSAGIISGYDACSGNVVAGVAVPDSTYVQSGIKDVVFGEPPVDNMGTPQEMADATHIDWENIIHPTSPSVSPDAMLCRPGTVSYDSNRGPCGSFPTAQQFEDPDFWPTIVVNGSTPLPEHGRGTLIVTGNLTFGGGDKWNGIILVGGIITDNGSGHIEGAVITGLNAKLGEPVGKSSKAEGTKDYIYNSCDIASAMGGMARLAQVPNAWADNSLTW
jgi:hypothetical protein